MANLVPAANVTISGIAMALTSMILQTMQANMIIIPEQVMDNLPGIIAVIAAYGWDLITGGNKKPSDLPQTVAEMKAGDAPK